MLSEQEQLELHDFSRERNRETSRHFVDLCRSVANKFHYGAADQLNQIEIGLAIVYTSEYKPLDLQNASNGQSQYSCYVAPH